MKAGSYAEHQNIIQRIKLALIQLYPSQIMFFDRHVGLLYTQRGTPIQIGIRGQADLYFIIMVNGYPCHVEVEIKSGEAVQSKEQKLFEKAITKLGGLYILARSADDVLTELQKKWPELRK